MLASAIPTRFPIPFGNSAGAGYIRTVPQASQIGIQAGAASLTDGFPPVTFIATSAGGTPPFGQDFNGLLNQVTKWSQWQAAGNATTYNSGFSTSIGGYPEGAILASTTAGLYWLSTTDNNTSNPDAGGANWVAFLTTESPSVIYSGTDTGAANAYALTTTSPITPAAYFTGMIVAFLAVHANTGPSTIAIASLGAKSLVNNNGAALAAAAVAAGQPIFAVYNGTAFVSISQLQTGSIPFPGLPINGLATSNITGSSTTASMTVGSGGCSNNLGTQSILSNSNINWAVSNGNAANGYQGGTTLPSSASLYMYLIWGASGIATFVSGAINTPTLPSGYSYFRLIFPFTTDSSGNPIPFSSYEGAGGSLICSYATVVVEPTVFPVPAANRILVNVTVPLGLQLEWRGRGATAQLGGTPGENTLITSPGDPDTPATATGTNSFGDMFATSSGGGLAIFGKAVVVTNTAGQVGARVSGVASVGTSLYLFTQGFTYNRRL